MSREYKEYTMKERPYLQMLDHWIHADYDFLFNENKLRNLIDDIVVATNMVVLVPTIFISLPIARFKESINEEDLGLTGFTVIDSSHIAIHTWPRKGWGFLQVVSCKGFVEKDVIDIVNYYLEN